MAGVEVVGSIVGVLPLTVSLKGALRFEQNKANDRELVLSFAGLQKERIDEIQDELIRLQAEREVLRTEIKSLRVQAETLRTELESSQTGAEDIFISEISRHIKDSEKLSTDEYLSGREKYLNKLGDEIDMKLKTYVQALQNYDFLTQDPMPDPFPAWVRSFGRKRQTLEAGDDKTQVRTDEKYKAGLLEPRGIRELDREGREERERKKKKWQRLTMGMFGGVALIAPMILMVLLNSSTTSLVTTSVATFLFAAILAFFGRTLAGQDVLAATAAYTAVLVVFVGASSPSSS